MSKPQLEKGYTRIANEIMEALCKLRLSSYEWSIIIFVMRKTYGWNKKSDLIPLSQIAEGTRISKPNICHSLKHLISRSIIVRLDNKHIGFQKDYEKWLQKLSKQTTGEKLSIQTMSVVDLNNKSLSIQTPSKDTTKDNTSKDKVLTEPRQARQAYEERMQKLEHTTSTHLTIDRLREKGKFHDWLEYLNRAGLPSKEREPVQGGKVGVLVEAFRAWHKNAPDIDWENTGGRMAQLFSLANKDAGYLLKILWETAAADIAGSHLSFIQGKLRSQKGGRTAQQKLPTADELEQSWKGKEGEQQE